MKETIEEIEGSQMGVALTADNGASPCYLTELSENISFDDPLRHRITDGIVPHRIALFTRILDLGGIAVDIPEDPVHKGFQPVEPSGLGDLHRLVNCR